MRLAIAAVLCIAVGALAAPTTAPTTAPANNSAAIVVLNGEINDFSRTTTLNRIDEARGLGAATVILQLNTPGGMVGPALEMSRFIKRQDDLHIIAYVDEMAYSAGALIALACDEIVMQPGSFMGDCAPIVPGEKLEGAERAKAESPLLAEFYDSAQRNGYDPLLAQAMVQYGRIVHFIENDQGERRFVNEVDYEKLTKEGWKAVEGVPNPVDGPNELLTVNADVAQKLGLSQGEAANAAALAESRGLTVLATLAPSGGEEIIGWLSSMYVRGFLTVIFMLSLYMAFSHPGHGAPEASAVICLSVLVGVPLLTGYAQWWEILVIVLGLVLVAVEIFLIPGFGFTGITGIVLVLAGLTMTWVGREPIEIPGVMPKLQGSWDAMRQGLIIVVGGMICSLLLWLWLQRYLPKLPYFSRLILTTTSGDEIAATPRVARPYEIWPPVGSRGKVLTDLRPGGTASFHDPAINDTRVADVVCDSGFVPAGTDVIVREVHGNHVVVRAVT